MEAVISLTKESVFTHVKVACRKEVVLFRLFFFFTDSLFLFDLCLWFLQRLYLLIVDTATVYNCSYSFIHNKFISFSVFFLNFFFFNIVANAWRMLSELKAFMHIYALQENAI